MKIQINPNKKSSFLLRGIHPKQMEAIKSGKMPLGVFIGLLGGGAGTLGFGYVHNKLATILNSEASEDMEDSEVVDDSDVFDYEVPTTAEFADSVTDNMSFDEAYATARGELGQGGFFVWKGQYYHTYTKEEWGSFSDEDKSEFFRIFKENANFENAEEREHDPDPVEEINDDYEPNREIEDTVDDGEMVELDEIGTDDEIIEGLNDGEAYEEEENFGEDIV